MYSLSSRQVWRNSPSIKKALKFFFFSFWTLVIILPIGKLEPDIVASKGVWGRVVECYSLGQKGHCLVQVHSDSRTRTLVCGESFPKVHLCEP